jgi:iron-sulfur cluster repair protein YtfE (RIC family)
LEPLAETAQGRALFEELLWVHGAIRRDLATVEELAREVASGLPAEEARERIEGLRTGGPLWQLKVNCLRYCRFVHSHHNAEDALFFPTLRAANPAVGGVIDRLEAEHRSVSDLLDAVESAAVELDDDEESPRARLAEGLTALADQLLAHLEYEEREAGPTIRSLERHPFLTGPPEA